MITNTYGPIYGYHIKGVSYIGNPKSNTAMYVSKKIDSQLENLKKVENCLIFVESGSFVPEGLHEHHTIVITENPQLAYAAFVHGIESKIFEEQKTIGYRITNDSYISENSKIGADAYIEPGCRIGHNVVIGDKAVLLTGTTINHAVIGNNFLSNEYAVIGANGFTMADDADGNKIRIPALGGVQIGDNVEVGAHDNISRGSAGDTILHDNVKLDAFVHIGHDAVIHNNVEVTAGAIVGGFDEIGENAFIGLNAILRNRIVIGRGVTIGMGAVVTKSVEDSVTVIGNPAHPMSGVGGVRRAKARQFILSHPERYAA